MHLTNFAVNKENPQYNDGSKTEQESSAQHKRSIIDFFGELSKHDINTDEI